MIWPLVLIYYVDAVMLAAWCELRRGLRHFRLDRVTRWHVLADRFTGQSEALLALWETTQKEQTVLTRDL